MPTKKVTSTKILQAVRKISPVRPERTVEWFGGVNYTNLEKTLARIRRHMIIDAGEEIHLLVSSCGGATGIALSFHDTIKSVLKPNLVTIGTGDVDSSGVIVFLTGEKRFLTKNTTMLLHLGGRTLAAERRYSTQDLENLLNENRLRDYQYACLLADATNGRATPARILELMAKNTILTAEEALNLGLAHHIL